MLMKTLIALTIISKKNMEIQPLKRLWKSLTFINKSNTLKIYIQLYIRQLTRVCPMYLCMYIYISENSVRMLHTHKTGVRHPPKFKVTGKCVDSKPRNREKEVGVARAKGWEG